MKILANDGISPLGEKLLREAGYTVITEKVPQNELIDYINTNGVSMLIVRSATTARQDLIDACPGLQLIGRGGVGMDNIDVAYARENGKIVINTPGASSQSVAELVMGHLFSLSRNLHDSFKHMENGDFSLLKKKYAKGVELRGKTLGIIGFGRIGQSLATYALGVGMEVIAVSKNTEPVEISVPIGKMNRCSVTIQPTKDLHAVLGAMDYISLHVPKQPDGSAVISTSEFEKMKPGVRIVNAARGGVIDESALLSALEKGEVACVGLDVYENEPQPRVALLQHENIACTPHIGAATLEAQDRIGEELASQIIEHFGRHNS
jgi:D-3-phosphoglycerate dehydrogenase